MRTEKFVKAFQKASRPKTQGYDTQAEVRRVEGGTAWVHIPGGVDETPVKLTIDAKAGDNVQVRVSGGKAFLVGNATAPPTDNTVANEANSKASFASEAIEEQQEHFWYDGLGAHIEGISSGYRNDLKSDGMYIVKNGVVVAKFGTETEIYTTDGTELVHFGYDSGTDLGGGTATAPYYTLGKRRAGSTIGNYSLVCGFENISSRFASYSEGYATSSGGIASHAEGIDSVSSADAAHAEGRETSAAYMASHAEGYKSETTGQFGHAEGLETSAYYAAHSEGWGATASGAASHAEGRDCQATATYSHAEGWQTVASGTASHAQGYGTYATAGSQTTIGRWNEVTSSTTTDSDGNEVTTYDAGDYAFIIGIGSRSSNRANGLTVDWSGNVNAAGQVKSKTTTGSVTITSGIFSSTWLNTQAVAGNMVNISIAGTFTNTSAKSWTTIGTVANPPAVEQQGCFWGGGTDSGAFRIKTDGTISVTTASGVAQCRFNTSYIMG